VMLVGKKHNRFISGLIKWYAMNVFIMFIDRI